MWVNEAELDSSIIGELARTENDDDVGSHRVFIGYRYSFENGEFEYPWKIYVFHDGMVQCIERSYIPRDSQILVWKDIDDDGTDELVFLPKTLSGLGVYANELIIFEVKNDGSFAAKFLSQEMIETMIQEKFRASVSGDTITLTLIDDVNKEITKEYKEEKTNITHSARISVDDIYDKNYDINKAYKLIYCADVWLQKNEKNEYVYRNAGLAWSTGEYYWDNYGAEGEFIMVDCEITAEITYDGTDFDIINLSLSE